MTTKPVEKREIGQLRPHPLLASLYPPATPCEVEELARVIAGGGQDQLPEVLPDGTLLSGVKHVEAAKLLGREEIDVLTRHDLAAQGAKAAERRAIECCLASRPEQLERVRCHLLLRTLAGPLSQDARAALRRDLAAQLGSSGRSVDRLLRIVERAPVEVQHAVSSGSLPMAAAEQVAGLSKAQQQQLVGEIRAGAGPAAVVRRHLPRGAGRRRKGANLVRALLRSLQRLVPDLQARLATAAVRLDGEDLALLARTEEVIAALRARAAAEARSGSSP